MSCQKLTDFVDTSCFISVIRCDWSFWKFPDLSEYSPVLDMKSVITPFELYNISWNISLVYHVSLCSMGQSARSWSFKVYYLLNEHLLPLDCTPSCMYCTDKILHWLIINVIVTDSKLDKFVCNLPSLMNYEKPCIPWCCLGLYNRASIPMRLSLDGNRTDVCWN